MSLRENSLKNDKLSTKSVENALMHADNITGIYYPTTEDSHNYNVKQPSENLPVPPAAYWHWYAKDEDAYLSGGKTQAKLFHQAACKNGVEFKSGSRILDFGCSGGRVIRWFSDEAQNGAEIWGCDIDAPAIEWCQKNMMPPFKFFANSTAPHLPIRDDYFDFIYAGSVINHIKDMASSWIMEIARCIKPGGIFIPTIIDEYSIPLLVEIYKKDQTSILPKHVVENKITVDLIKKVGFINRYSTTTPWLTGVIYSSDFFKRRVSLTFECLDVIPKLKGYQTGYVLRVPRK